MSLLVAALSMALSGCGGAGERVADLVPVKGQVTLSTGQPVKDVLLTLQPLETGHMAGLKVGTDGRFTGELVPGKYAYFFGAQESNAPAERQEFEAALKVIPDKYRIASLEHTVAIAAGDEVLIHLH